MLLKKHVWSFCMGLLGPMVCIYSAKCTLCRLMHTFGKVCMRLPPDESSSKELKKTRSSEMSSSEWLQRPAAQCTVEEQLGMHKPHPVQIK